MASARRASVAPLAFQAGSRLSVRGMAPEAQSRFQVLEVRNPPPLQAFLSRRGIQAMTFWGLIFTALRLAAK
jgi:hypothetical protein